MLIKWKFNFKAYSFTCLLFEGPIIKHIFYPYKILLFMYIIGVNFFYLWKFLLFYYDFIIIFAIISIIFCQANLKRYLWYFILHTFRLFFVEECWKKSPKRWNFKPLETFVFVVCFVRVFRILLIKFFSIIYSLLRFETHESFLAFIKDMVHCLWKKL